MRRFNLLLAGVTALTLNVNLTTAPTVATPDNSQFKSLEQSLNSQNWKAANEETRRLIHQWIYPNQDLYAKPQLNNLSCPNLKTIDQLWLKASNGRFGLSVQQQSWQKNAPGNNRSKIESFGKQMGWVRTQPLTEDELISKFFASTWMMETELNYTPKAPVGHLPWHGISAERIVSMIKESGPGCGSCSVDAMYLQEERNYTYLPAFYDRVKTCLAVNTTALTQLENALAAGNWKEANRLTSLRVLEMAGQKKRGYLVATDTRNLSCPEFREIDQLWTKYSQGKFGFSVQAQIWQNLKGKNYEDSLKFEQIVGWKGTQPTFDVKTAPKGHLPLRPVLSEGMMNAWGGGWIQEMSLKVKGCQLK